MDKNVAIDDYIATQASHVQVILRTLRSELAQALPDCQEKISYSIPTLFAKKVVIHYGANKAHLGIYPFPQTIDHFEDQVAAYRKAKGTLQFPYDQEIPYDLIVALAVYNYHQQQ